MFTLSIDIVRVLVIVLPILFSLISCFANAQTVLVTDSSGRAYFKPLPQLDSIVTITKDVSTKARKLFSQVTSVAVSGYTVNTDYSLKGAIVGSDTIKANTPMGTTIVGFGAGSFTTPTLNVGAITVKILLGGIVVLSNSFSGLPVGIGSQSPFQSKISMTVRAGAVAADGYIDFSPVTGTGAVRMPFTTSVTNIDWTKDNVFDIKVQYSNPGNYLNLINQNLLQY